MMYSRTSPRAQRHDLHYHDDTITICTKDRLHYFGEIVDGVMTLNTLGKWCTEHWGQISDHYPQLVCDEFICMPNHIQGIIIGESVGTQFLASGNNNDISRTDKNPSLQS